MSFNMNERREKILRLIIDHYIDSGVPVSSRAMCSQYRLDLCPASVRNVMADLEELGLITHLHTSAGRVPTDKGYRFYVDRLLASIGLTHQEQDEINQEFLARQLALEEVMRKTSRVLSTVTHYAAVVSLPEVKRSAFKRIQFMPLGSRHFCVTLITNTGATKSAVIHFDLDIDIDMLQRIENFMNSQLADTPLHQLKTKLRRMMIQERHSFFYLLQQAIDLIDLTALIDEHTSLYFEGIGNMLCLPEFANGPAVLDFVRTLDDRDSFGKFLDELVNEDEEPQRVRVVIGGERNQSVLRQCALVVSDYRVHDRAVGALGIIGPKRMNYGRAIATVRYMSDLLSRTLSQFSV